MNNFYINLYRSMENDNYSQTIAWEFQWDEEKLIKKLVADWNPSFGSSSEFKSKLDSKIQEKIRLTKEQKQEQAALDAVPKNLKWRFYLTWYWYAVCSFLVLFLIWFCTNIFTWTLKIPTKYNYMEETQAFGNLERWWELTYNRDLNRASNFSYDSFDVDVLNEEEMDSEELELNTVSSVTNSVAKIAETRALWTNITENFLAITEETDSWDDTIYWDYLLADKFVYNQTYRFAYKDKLFPKLNAEYPVYKTSWILMWSNTPNQALKNLKIWNVSFKNFQDLDIMSLEMEQWTENWYNIIFDKRNMKLNFYPNSSWKASEYSEKLPSNKQVLKNVEKDLKNLWVSLKNYWEWIVNSEEFDENMWILQVFYPFLIQWKSVRYAEWNSEVWMHVAYDLNLQKVVSIVWIDIATYDVSNYPTLDKKFIESEIEQWGEYYSQWALHEDSTVILFDWMDVVYTEKLINWEIMYIPTIRSTVSTSLDNYVGPSVIYEEII